VYPPYIHPPLPLLWLQAAAAKLAEAKRAGGGKSQLPGLSVGNAAAVDAALTASETAQDDELVSAAKQRLEMRLGVLTGSLEGLLQHVFGLLGRLTEVGVCRGGRGVEGGRGLC
jgi:hypothetical protein